MTETSVPSDRRYTSEHEWAMQDGEVVRVGITDWAQSQLGDVVYVDVPATNAVVTGEQAFGEVESTKSVSDLYAPMSGTIVERNDELDDRPELVNEDPYGDGWLVAIKPDDPGAFDGLLDAEGYRALLP